MLIYLDTMVVQYIADNQDYIFQDIISTSEIPNPSREVNFARELDALRRLAFLEQYGQWDFAVSLHLEKELFAGTPTEQQLETYKTLLQAWKESGWFEMSDASDEKVLSIEHLLSSLKYKDKADKHHLAEAMAISASWFITNDKNIIQITRKKESELLNLADKYVLNDPELTAHQMLKRLLRTTIVARPSECVEKLERTMILK